jgi:xanthine/CO dehydrogenase XdhC/CoxF family maturation factor
MSKEISQILRAYDTLDPVRRKAALATVVHVEGSSYRRPGARMLVSGDGIMTGAISGGCLEGDALRKARLVMHKGEAAVITYDTTEDDDWGMGVGLGCNGIIHVLLEPLDPNDPANPVELIRSLHSGRQSGVLATLFDPGNRTAVPPGTCAAFPEKGTSWIDLDDAMICNVLERKAKEVIAERRSKYIPMIDAAGCAAFLEWMEPPVSLVIVGAGNDAVPLTELAHTMGWEVTIADGRVSHARPERFPLADAVHVIQAEALPGAVRMDARTCFVLMTHNYRYDIVALKGLLALNPRYIGVLGPKKKMQRMVDELGLGECPPNVYGPVGLDIGAESPEEIALSVVSEIKAVMSGREAASLKNLTETIHSRLYSVTC